MSIETIIIASFVGIAAVVTLTLICLEKARSDYRKEAEYAPKYRIVPSINGRYSLEKKHILHRASGLCMYMPLNSYATRDDARRDLEHLLNG